jgi:hypothetical protein
VGWQWLGRYGKTDSGVVTVTTVWADERLYYPVHAVPYTPARHFPRGKNDPEFRTKLAIGADLAVRAQAAGFTFRAVVADSAYSDQDGFRARRLVAVTADPGTLPDKATWYLVTNLARPGGPREQDSPWPAASLDEITRIYGLRHWVEQSCKQVKDELGWADFQVRSDIAIRRHQVLVNCAFSFCRLAPARAGTGKPAREGAPPPGPSSPGHARASSRYQAGPARCAPSAAG